MRKILNIGADVESARHCYFEDIGIDDVSSMAGKNASLGEMYQELTAQGVNVPNGFAVTAEAYRKFEDEYGQYETFLNINSGGQAPLFNVVDGQNISQDKRG